MTPPRALTSPSALAPPPVVIVPSGAATRR